MKRFDPIINVENDGKFIPEVRIWSIEKYKLFGNYCDIFTTGMKRQWDQLIYIDLYAGAGYVKIIETNQILKSSSLISLSIPNPFTKYILCEKNLERFKALKYRIEKYHSDKDVTLIFGDCNEKIDEIKKAIPKFGKGNTLLPFCFADPFSLNLNFSTIRLLGQILMDFLILQALHMDANRNFDKYIKDENKKIANYLGNINWRKEFVKNENSNRNNFIKFLADQYQKQMTKLNYQPIQQMHQIRSNIKNLPLYYLSFYSKHTKGNEFFNKVIKYCNPQIKMEF